MAGGEVYVVASDCPGRLKSGGAFYCDGVADDVQIQAAIDLLDPEHDGTVRLSPGHFYTLTALTIPNGIRIVGTGNASFLDGCQVTEGGAFAAKVSLVVASALTPTTLSFDPRLYGLPTGDGLVPVVQAANAAAAAETWRVTTVTPTRVVLTFAVGLAAETYEFFVQMVPTAGFIQRPKRGAFDLDAGVYTHRQAGELIADTLGTVYSQNFGTDVFSGGGSSEFVVVKGTWDVSAGQLRSTTTGISITKRRTHDTVRDFKVSLKITNPGTTNSHHLGVALRGAVTSTDKLTGYVVRFRGKTSGGTVDIVDMRDSVVYATLGDVGTWNNDAAQHAVVIKCVGSLIQVWVSADANPPNEATMPTVQAYDLDGTYDAGWVGFYAAGVANCLYDDVVITEVVGIHAAPPNVVQNGSTVLHITSEAAITGLTVTDPAGNTRSLTTPGDVIGEVDATCVFPDDFSGADTRAAGPYVVTATTAASESHTSLEVIEKPLCSFVQFTDSHIGTNAASAYMRRLRELVAEVEAERLFAKPDFVVGTGDLTEKGYTAELANLVAALSGLTVPFYPIAGNHDADTGSTGDEHDATVAGTTWANVFGTNRYTYAWSAGGCRFVGIADDFTDTEWGALSDSAANLAFIAAEIAAYPTAPKILFTHKTLAAVRDGGSAADNWDGETHSAPVRTVLETDPNWLANFGGHSHINGLAEVNGIIYAQCDSLANSDGYRWVRIYSDRIEITSHMLQAGRHDLSGQVWGSSTDSTHVDAETYTFGLPWERDVILDRASQSLGIVLARQMYDDVEYSDVVVSADVTMAKQGLVGESVAGLVVRMQDEDNYYLVLLNTQSDRAEIWKVVDGDWTLLDSDAVTLALDTKYALSVECNGTGIAVSVDATPVVSTTDSAFAGGLAGIACWRAPCVLETVAVAAIPGP